MTSPIDIAADAVLRYASVSAQIAHVATETGVSFGEARALVEAARDEAARLVAAKAEAERKHAAAELAEKASRLFDLAVTQGDVEQGLKVVEFLARLAGVAPTGTKNAPLMLSASHLDLATQQLRTLALSPVEHEPQGL